MIDHDRAQELATAALDFPLSVDDRQALTAHLDGCDACRTFDTAVRADARRLSNLAAHDAPDTLRQRILTAAREVPKLADDAAATAVPVPGPSPRRLRSIPPRYRRPAAVLAAAAVIVALVGGTLVWRSSPRGGPDVATATPSPSDASTATSPTPAPSGLPTTAASTEVWTPIANLTADDAKSGVVALASGFRLASLNGTPAAALASHLSVEPPVSFAVAVDTDGRSARITPREPLTAGAVYRFTLTADDGRTLDSWAFQAHQPLQVVGTVPGDATQDVPTNTGIEATFDQDGVVDAASHFSIVPTVAGRFEQHGRTLAFIPAKRLAPATLYTVKISRGVTVTGTDDVLEADARFRFETAAATTKGKVRTMFRFTSGLFDATTTESAAIGVMVQQDWDQNTPEPAPPKKVHVEVDRLPNVDAAIAAYREIGTVPPWARRTPRQLVATKGLAKVAAFDGKIQQSDYTPWVQLPKALPAGWYVVTLPSTTPAIQTILQVTDLAGYVLVSETKTLVWANDLNSGRPVAGASVRSGGVDLGVTGADGTRIVDTPPAMSAAMTDACTDGCGAVVTLRSGDRTTILPVGDTGVVETGAFYRNDGTRQGATYWQTFDTDRTIYRRTDTINAWGVVRDRVTGAVPAVVKLRLSSVSADDRTLAGAPVATSETHPNAVGAYSGSLPVSDLPEGDYQVDSSVGDVVVGSRSIRIDRILKPAYRLEVTTGHRVYIQGDPIAVTATATFYEGSPVPGVPLRVEGVTDTTIKTGPDGTANEQTTAHVDFAYYDNTPNTQGIMVTPASAEEGEISGTSQDIAVFPSLWTIEAAAVIDASEMRVTGSVHAVDRERLEREMAAGAGQWDLNVNGQPIADKTLTAAFTESIPYRVQTGTAYDFIEKKVMPVYDYGTTERDAGSFQVTTRSDGAFAVSIPATEPGHSWRVRLTTTDPDGHDSRAQAWASLPGGSSPNRGDATLVQASGSVDHEFGVGEAIDLMMQDPGLPANGAGRYLFYTASRGLQQVAVGTSSSFHTALTDQSLPGLEVGAVRFSGSRYVEAGRFVADFRRSDRALTVDLATDQARYAPGAEVTMTVTTRDRNGQPVSASVVLRGVDRKLFDIGAAAPADPLAELYAGAESGILATYHSHAGLPFSDEGGGDTTGGGDGGGRPGRDDFRDWVLFKQVQTGSDGRAVVTFHVADDLTSWQVGASAFADGLRAGEASKLVAVGLPFFVDATIATDYLVTDRPSIGLRAYGTDLASGAPVTFAVESESLGLHLKDLKGTAFETTTVPLPNLTIGTHSVTITATSGPTAAARDVLTRTFTVLPSRLARTQADHVDLPGQAGLKGGDGRVEVNITDAGAAQYIPLLLGLTDVETARLEPTLAASQAASLVRDRFDFSAATPAIAFDGQTYQTDGGGVTILPYSSSDIDASVLAALIAPDRFDRDRLEAYLWSVIDNPKTTREHRTFALAGLGGLGAAVLPQLRSAAADPGLTVRERLMIGLGAAALGDAARARSIGASLETEFGEITSDYARIRAGKTDTDIAQGTALMAMLAAADGDALAPRFWSYVEANHGEDATYPLHAVGFVTRLLGRAVSRPASFAYTLDGVRQVVNLEPGKRFYLSLGHSQFTSLALETLTGQIGVTTSWQQTVAPTAIARDPDITVSRGMTPGGPIDRDTLVRVDLTVDLGSKAPAGCHLVTDLVPSGLVPVGNLQGWIDPGSDNSAPKGIVYPYAQVGQRVTFCAEKTKKSHIVNLRYFARVVTSGTYTWEPTIVESRTAADRAALSKSGTITIR